MSTLRQLISIPVEQYIEEEKKSEVRHELVDGQVYAMVGASNAHNLIAGRLYVALHGHLREPCVVYMSDMKVRTANDFYYPDLVVSCAPLTGLAYYVDTPTIIVEVLSGTTESRDRVEKSAAYRKLPSLQEYALIAQDKVRVEIMRRTPKDWEIETFTAGDVVTLKSIGFTIPIDSIYETVARNLWL